MMLLRSILAVVVSWGLFATFTSVLFGIVPANDHLGFAISSTLCGMAFALVGGFIAAGIAGRKPRLHAAALAIALATTAILVKTQSDQKWSWLTAWPVISLLFLVACAGGWLYQYYRRPVGNANRVGSINEA